MKLRQRAARLFGRPAPLSENSIEHTKVDRAVFNDVRRRSATLGENIGEPPVLKNGDELDYRVWEKLAEDTFYSFFGADSPEVKQRDQVDPRFRVNREIASKQARSDDFIEQHALTRGEVLESTLGTIGALRSLRDSYQSELAEHGEIQNEIAACEDGLDDLDNILAGLREQRKRDDADTERIDAEIREAAQEKRETLDLLRKAEKVQADASVRLTEAVAGAVEAAADAAKQAVETASLLPGKGAGQTKRVSPDEILRLAERVHCNETMRKVLEMMGRLELSMGTTRRQMRKGGYEEMVDIETGDDLQLVLPHEKALLSHPVGRLDFYRRYHERALMQYEMWSEQELKRGPIIFLADGSDSMRGAPNIFCRGLTLAACAIGNREGRNTCAVEFGSTGQLRSFFFPKDQPLDTSVALDFAEHFFAGGTDINMALNYAMALVGDEHPFHSADVVIVTDGQDNYTPQTEILRNAFREMGVKIHGIAVASAPSPYLLEVCDATSAVWDFAGPNNTSDRLAIDLS